MLRLEVDGRQVEVAHGATVMEAAHRLGIYVPHFCYHRKLSIAANCRMCLVEVEKAPKPLPACATPVTDGMKVWTHSVRAKQAQNGVMEFLLINHPLDCPICDQGGECQLQDLAVGYGKSASRYAEEKRYVPAKDVGPLVSAEEMSRCIHCTRCVRFGQEIAGVMELGMIGRGEHAEIVAFVGETVDSELSGNMIDLCPVGALTSKPFRYAARTWELARRKSVAPHDSLGSNLVLQVKQNKVLRVLPLENEAVNECWLSDRDRFSYEALDSADRLTRPMVRTEGGWQVCDWQTALDAAAGGLRAAGADLGILATPNSTLEELHLAGRLAAATGGASDFRLRRSDFPAQVPGAPWLGMRVAELEQLDRVLVVGSFLRKDHPLLAHRLRQAAKRGAQVSLLHCADDDPLMRIAHRQIVAPAELPGALAGILAGPIGDSLRSGQNVAVLLGTFAEQHASATAIHAAAAALVDALAAARPQARVRLGFLGEAANSVGGYLAGAHRGPGTRAMLERPRSAYVLVNAEPELDCADPHAAMSAMRSARCVVALSAFRHRALDYAHVLLPVTPFTETAGTFVNCEGRVQGFHPAVRPAGEARPGWKVLRVLGNLLGAPGFEFETAQQVRDSALAGEYAVRLSNAPPGANPPATAGGAGLERIADVPIYAVDALVRRAASLQRTADAGPPRASMNSRTAARLGVVAGQPVLVRQGGEARLEAAIDDRLPDDCVRVPAGHPLTAGLGALCGRVEVLALPVQKVA